MNVVEVRACVRCGATFRPLAFDQVCCTEECSNLLQNRQLPAVAERRQVPRAMPHPSQRFHGRRGPIFSGMRFVVFEWQVEQLARMLGPLIDEFDLHEWFFLLDERMRTSHEVIPQRDGGQWLMARTIEEAQRRGLPVASADQPPAMGKQTSRLAQALANIKNGWKS